MFKNIFSDKKFKKTLVFFIGLFLFLLILNLNFYLLSGRLSSPSLILKRYIKALYSGDYRTAYQFVCDRDKKYKSIKEYLREKESETSLKNILENSMLPLSEISVVKTANDSSDIEIIEKTPVMENDLSKDLIKKLRPIIKEGKNNNHKKRNQSIYSFIKGNDFPRKDTTKRYRLVMEKGGWRICLDWEKMLKIKIALEEAKKYEINNDLEKAIKRYNDILNLDKLNEEANQRVAALLPFIQTKEYLQNLEFLEMEVKLYKDPKLGKKFGIFGRIRNKGNKTIKEIQINVKLLNQDGNILLEEDISPIDKGEKAAERQLLKPNSVIKFGYRIEEPLLQWKGKLSYKITKIEFE